MNKCGLSVQRCCSTLNITSQNCLACLLLTLVLHRAYVSTLSHSVGNVWGAQRHRPTSPLTPSEPMHPLQATCSSLAAHRLVVQGVRQLAAAGEELARRRNLRACIGRWCSGCGGTLRDSTPPRVTCTHMHTLPVALAVLYIRTASGMGLVVVPTAPAAQWHGRSGGRELRQYT